MLLGERLPPASDPAAWWTLSLFSPGPSDAIHWDRGSYRLVTRSGRSLAGQQKLSTHLVGEGSVLVSSAAPVGAAIDVAPPGAPHPLWRAAFAVAVPIPWAGPHSGGAQ